MASLAGKKDSNGSYKSVQISVAERVKSTVFNDEVNKKFEDELVDREATRRAGALSIAWENIGKLHNDLRRLDKPDQVYYDNEGKIAQQLYTHVRNEELKKLRERIEKYERAFDHAWGGDFKDLHDLNNNFKDKGGGGEKNAGTSGSKDT